MVSTSEPFRLRLGTRGSPLALVQAGQVQHAIEAVSHGVLRVDLITFTTSGDQLTSERLTEAGGKGLFTKELDEALADGRIDLAVHSLKDVPAVLPPGQQFLAFPEREDAREGFVSHTAARLADLPGGAIVGTASLRREAQTRAVRPDLSIVTFRGNVQTRLRKLEEGLADATFLAMAGLNRLGLAHLAEPIPLEDMLPSAAQGILGIVARDDLALEPACIIRALNNSDAEAAAIAERAFLAGLDGNCRTPIAAHLFDQSDTWRLAGEVLLAGGTRRWRTEDSCPKDAGPEGLYRLGTRLAARLRDEAGEALPAFGAGN
jgi:hydroxymethylbilane synthase